MIAGKTYAIWVPYEGVILKRVFVNHSKNCLILQSDNPNHPDQELPIDERENLVIGQAKWVLQ